MYPGGRAGLKDCIDWGFKTREQIKYERMKVRVPK
jgi:hypothetical protein